MLPFGTRTASSACLKCQLRHVLSGLVSRTAYSSRCRQLSTTACYKQEHAINPDDEQESRRKQRSRFYYRHIHPDGRIIGKPGRRQRQRSETLSTTSLGKPAEVIVMKDVEEWPTSSSRVHLRGVDLVLGDQAQSRAPLSAEEIEAIITRRHKAPKQDEVNRSIDTLRPGTTLLERSEFDDVVKKLLNGYNMPQLLRYLVQSLSATPTPETSQPARQSEGRLQPTPTPETSQPARQDEGRLQPTPWRPGQSPIDQRVGLVSLKKSEASHTKAAVVDQIVRNAWTLRVHAEEQQVGELEISLSSWQITQLFDRTTREGRPAFESLLDSPLLRRTSVVRPFRPHNIVRITARRRDAEEIARRLIARLSDFGLLGVDLDVFKPLLGQSGRPQTLDKLFTLDDLRNIAERTDTVIEQPGPSTINIYSLPEQSRLHARRMLLSLLDLPSPKIVHSMVPVGHRGRGLLKTFSSTSADLELSEFPASNLHRRLINRKLYRLTKPSEKRAKLETPKTARLGKNGGMTASSRRTMMEGLAFRLRSVPSLVSWTEARQASEPQWRVKVCALLHTSSDALFDALASFQRRKGSESSQYFIHSNRVPGLTELLSYFTPLEAEKPGPSDSRVAQSHASLRPPLLVARFAPSPFSKSGISALRQLPRISFTFTLPHRSGFVKGEDRRPQLGSMRIVQQEEEVNVPFPEHTADLVFTKAWDHRQPMRSVGGKDIGVRGCFASVDEARRFEAAVQQSYANQSAMLDGLPEIKVQLSRWLTGEKLLEEEGGEPRLTDYMLERFEQVQIVNFVPALDRKNVDPKVEKILSQWPKGMVLSCTDVEAGAFAGRKTELSLVHKDCTDLQLTKSAIGLLEILTKADAGLLKSYVESSAEGYQSR